MSGFRGKKTIEVLFGKIRWGKLFQPSVYNKYSLELNPDEESLSKCLEWKKMGIRNVIKKDDEGYWITLSRNATYKIGIQEKINNPPTVLNSEGHPWPKDVAIGNGSDVAVQVAVRTYKVPGTIDSHGTAIRLEGVKVLNLVEFDPNAVFTRAERKQSEALDNAEIKPW